MGRVWMWEYLGSDTLSVLAGVVAVVVVVGAGLDFWAVLTETVVDMRKWA